MEEPKPYKSVEQDKKDITLLPCPFCGGKASNAKGKYGDGADWFYIECDECGASAEVEIWNTRCDRSEKYKPNEISQGLIMGDMLNTGIPGGLDGDFSHQSKSKGVSREELRPPQCHFRDMELCFSDEESWFECHYCGHVIPHQHRAKE